jgi:hypothetical protein
LNSDDGEKMTTSLRDSKELTSASARAENGVSGGGFITAVQPAASAAPNFRVIMAEGKFHGVRIELTYLYVRRKVS